MQSKITKPVFKRLRLMRWQKSLVDIFTSLLGNELFPILFHTALSHYVTLKGVNILTVTIRYDLYKLLKRIEMLL